jgi:hypothetical protein
MDRSFRDKTTPGCNLLSWVSCSTFAGEEALNLGLGVKLMAKAGDRPEEAALVQTPQGRLAET